MNPANHVAVNGTELWCTTLGSGVPLLVMHGGLGLDHTYLRPLDALAEQAEIIYYDHRGNGRSAEPDDWAAVTHETWVTDADALRTRLGHERVVLFGHSYGGVLALEYALRYPGRVAGLILCSTYPAFDYPETVVANAQARGTPEQIGILLAGLSAPIKTDADLGRSFRAILPLYFHEPRPEWFKWFDDIEYRSAAFNRGMFDLLPGLSLTDRLPGITAPTLILTGADDWIAPAEHGAARLHAGIPGSQLAIFERSGHFPFIEESHAFMTKLSAWLGELQHEPAAVRDTEHSRLPR